MLKPFEGRAQRRVVRVVLPGVRLLVFVTIFVNPGDVGPWPMLPGRARRLSATRHRASMRQPLLALPILATAIGGLELVPNGALSLPLTPSPAFPPPKGGPLGAVGPRSGPRRVGADPPDGTLRGA